jgi:hypothetical protein
MTQGIGSSDLTDTIIHWTARRDRSRDESQCTSSHERTVEESLRLDGLPRHSTDAGASRWPGRALSIRGHRGEIATL